MKVDITLTVGGNDVSIGYDEGKALFLELRKLYQPSDIDEIDYSQYDMSSGTMAASTKSCGIKNTEPVVEPKTDVFEALEEMAEDPVEPMTTEEVDAKGRIQKMQDIINSMQTELQ